MNAKSSQQTVKISKTLSWILRHGASEIGVELDDNGWAKIDDLRIHPKLKKVSLDKINEIVKNCPKQRFAIKVEDDITYIRANQGHSIQEVDLQLAEVSEELYPHVYHGTFMKCWPKIQVEGLSRMSRQHVHFSPQFPKSKKEAYRMRVNCQIIIEVDVGRLIKDGYKFLRSENDVILCSGNSDGIILPEYFSRVIERKTGKDLLLSPATVDPQEGSSRRQRAT